jgi:hypothetical protein
MELHEDHCHTDEGAYIHEYARTCEWRCVKLTRPLTAPRSLDGWASTGLHAEDGDPLGISCLIRSQNAILTGDDYGRISVFPYPCPAPAVRPQYKPQFSGLTLDTHTKGHGANSRAQTHEGAGNNKTLMPSSLGNTYNVQRYAGHASTVVSIAVSRDERYAVSAGESDGCLVVWSIVHTPPRREGMCVHLDSVVKRLQNASVNGQNANGAGSTGDDGWFDHEEEEDMFGEGDVMASVKKYVSWLLPPTDYDPVRYVAVMADSLLCPILLDELARKCLSKYCCHNCRSFLRVSVLLRPSSERDSDACMDRELGLVLIVM